MKLTALLTLLCMLLLGSSAYSQGLGDPVPVQLNTITRTPCLLGYVGCSNTSVDLTLSSSSLGFGISKPISSSSTTTYPIYNTKIKVTFGGLTSTGSYTLPTVTGDQVVIPSTDGIAPFTVIITKTGIRQFKLEVASISF